MLQAAANVTPRGVYVCGNTATSSGLTVSAPPLIYIVSHLFVCLFYHSPSK